jgi:lambda repressor-like predicted transcriptional regulator
MNHKQQFAEMHSGELQDRVLELIGNRSANSYAQEFGLSEGTLRSILNGHIPRIDNVVAIAEASGVTVEWLVTGRGPKFYSDYPCSCCSKK